MTSSLVGSEMCIRDSTCTVLDVGCTISMASLRAILAFEAAAWQHGAWSVSYTHLTLPTICSV
eukprot:1632459-Prorocentrum_lima.AAC.1